MTVNGHEIQMHTTDAQDRLWLSCSCGWMSKLHPIPAEEDWHPVREALLRAGTDHYRNPGPGTAPDPYPGKTDQCP